MENNINNLEGNKKAKASGISVLIVDDCQLSIETLSYYLADQGHDVYTAIRGEETVSKVLALKPDIILLDLKMPGLGGLETLKTLKENAITENIPIIIVSACAQDLDIARALDHGASDYMVKPVEPSALADTMCKALESTGRNTN